MTPAPQSPKLVEELRDRRLIAIARAPRYERPSELAHALSQVGVSVIEFTFTGDNAAEAISTVKASHPDMLIGAGTVLSREQLTQASSAGADFAVSPILDPDLVVAAQGTIDFIPGAFTPTEVASAGELGCRVVKLYPARGCGLPHVTDLRTVLVDIELVPTGGIGLDEVGAYLRAGSLAVGLGSSLLEPGLSLNTVQQRARRALAATHGDR